MEIIVNLMGCSWNVMEMNVMLMRIDGISRCLLVARQLNIHHLVR